MIVKLNAVKDILENEFFLSKWNMKFHFLPAELYDWALLSNLKISICDIERWEDFEYGRTIFDENDLRNLIFNKEYSQTTEVLFISDESLIKEAAFKFRIDDYEEFVTYYEDVLEMEIFQPEDYIVYLREYKELRIVHHDGKLIKICRTENLTNGDKSK